MSASLLISLFSKHISHLCEHKGCLSGKECCLSSTADTYLCCLFFNFVPSDLLEEHEAWKNEHYKKQKQKQKNDSSVSLESQI